MAQALALSGRRQEALAELKRLHELAATRHVQALDFATVYASLGEKEKAFEWLEHGYRERLFTILLLDADPGYAPLRGDPRFLTLRRRVGLPG